MENYSDEDWVEENNYDKFLDYVDMQHALVLKNRYEKDFPNYMRRIFIEHDIMFKKTLKMIETKKLSKSSYFSILGNCIRIEKEFIYKCKNENEVVELENLTWNLVISNGWKVYHDGLKIIAHPPKQGA
mgnify:FL=1|jgi:hypothetical protein